MEAKRYSINRSPEKWDMNKILPRRTQTVCGTNLDEYRIIGYQVGDDIFKTDTLLWKHFDWVQIIKESTNPRKKTTLTAFIAYRNSEPTILITQKI